MVTVSCALDRVKDELGRYVPATAIEQACIDAAHRWRWRKFDPITTIQLFVLQVLCGNTAITHLRHLAKRPINPAAYCKARMRLPLLVLQRLLEHVALALSGAHQRLWCGLRTYLVDGSSSIAPDTPDNQKSFPQSRNQKKGCGFPTPKLLGLFDAFNGLIVRVLFFPLYTHDLKGALGLHPFLGEGDLLIGDRAFCSYAHFALLSARKALAVFRIHGSQIVDFGPGRKQRRKGQSGKPRSRFVKRLGPCDQLVFWSKPRWHCPKWMTPEEYNLLPAELQIRELRFTIPAKGQRTRAVIIATTLLDPLKYPKEKIAELYGVRWRVEICHSYCVLCDTLYDWSGRGLGVVKVAA